MNRIQTFLISVCLLSLLIGSAPLSSAADEVSTSLPIVTEVDSTSREIQEKTEDTGQETVFQMSLDELLDAKISFPAALTKLTSAEAPASITVITAEDIKYTPARNIYDLIEVYVPGAIWMNFEDGPQLGVRGIIANRNFKYLLRVNGRTLNNKGHYGAKSELEQWDMGDIQRIEIIRGPGSVTYGPGAVAGVINIITHDASSAEGLRLSTQYVERYDSLGSTGSYGYLGNNFGLFAFGSVTRTDGYKPDHFIGSNNNAPGYIGKDIQLDNEPMDYFADYDDDPQVKVHLDLSFLENWRLWSRYTQEGSTWRGNEPKSEFYGRLIDQQSVRDRQWTTTLQYESKLREDISLSVMLSADSSDVERRRDGVRNPDPDHALNKEIDFSETEIFFRTMANWQATDLVEIALGGEYSRDYFGPGWGDDRSDMRLGEGGIIVSGPSSDAIEAGNGNSADRFGTAVFTGDGWSTETFSLFSELNLTLKPWLKVLFSGRMDKNTYSDFLFSPRVSLISNFSDKHYLKLIAQQSQRMNTAGQLFADDKNGNSPSSETLTGVEMIYSAFPNERISYSLSSFMNNVDVIAWNEDIESSNSLGDLQLYGFEAEIDYKWSSGKVGANYSWVKQLDWDLSSGVPSSGISYSDYNQSLNGSSGVQQGVGNDLNNWPNQALKIFGRMELFDRLTLHADTRFLWDFEGMKDGLEGLSKAVAGTSEEAAVEEAIRRVKDVDTYDFDFRLNTSLTYKLLKALDIQVFAQNLLGANRNKRYSYDFSGINRASPHRVRFIEEERTFGISLNFQH